MSVEKKWGVAQLVERRPLESDVGGSSPSSPAIIITTLRPEFLDCIPQDSIGVLEKEFGRFKTKWISLLPITKAMLDEGIKPGDLFTSGYFYMD